MEYLYCSIIGYLIGTINPSYFIAKKNGFDIRTKGSGNAGASNALILFGKALGIICALLDIAKAYLAILLTETLFCNFTLAFSVTGIACVIGHIYPFYMKFKGGKGLACLGGIILYFNWKIFLIMLGAEILIAFITDYICFVPITASLVFPFIYGIIKNDLLGAFILGIITVLMIIKHIENFKRIRNGTEMRLSFLWKPDKEMERMKSKLSETSKNTDEHFTIKKTSK